MTYVITSACINDGACVDVCPVGCIHTTAGAPQFYIDPDVCIDCEQCELVCPVDAIFPDDDLPAADVGSLEVNAAFFRRNQQPPAPVSVELAQAMIAAAHAAARAAGVAVSVAVVDGSGESIAAAEMAGAPAASARFAADKAITAAALKMSSAEFAARGDEPWVRARAEELPGPLVRVGGAVPILRGVTVVGAVGVDGAGSPDLDVLCCLAALGSWERTAD